MDRTSSSVKLLILHQAINKIRIAPFGIRQEMIPICLQLDIKIGAKIFPAHLMASLLCCLPTSVREIENSTNRVGFPAVGETIGEHLWGGYIIRGPIVRGMGVIGGGPCRH